MDHKKLFLGKTPFLCQEKPVQGEVVEAFNDRWYKISNFDQMPPFLMNIVSDSDIWMFISSNGALTAGRKNPDNALFPYYTDDKIHDSWDITGSKTLLLIKKGDQNYLWEPLAPKYENLYQTQRNIYKNKVGNKLLFEEINHDLGLRFAYGWMSSEKLGIVKKAWIENLGHEATEVLVLDGIQNILPAGITRRFQNEYSTLADGYKRNERVAETTLGLFTLSSLPTDKAEPSESLKATTVWSTGLPNPKILLSASQLNDFRQRGRVEEEQETKGVRGAYFVCSQLSLTPGQTKEWFIVADLNQDHADVAALLKLLNSGDDLQKMIAEEINRGTEHLTQLLAHADAFQLTNDKRNDFRHCSNTLFNIMRGGIPANHYYYDKRDFLLYLQKTHKPVAQKYQKQLETLPERFTQEQLFAHITDMDVDLKKLSIEYLPLTFSRRHGDPSRPWNEFSIDIKDEHENQILNYQGNWRDIFQNWEALALSYPEFIEKMIAKFVNASSADGYNPYRVFKNGFEWEELDPADEWSNIGYWGDHQIIYLLKLLELSVNYHPGRLLAWLAEPMFTYANIPYRIKPYQELIKNPHDTIDFDFELNDRILQRAEEIGSSAKLLQRKDGQIYYVNLLEKLLVPLLVKLTNFVPEAGIWMNTQRPEWNDANNALVGYGTSMVTLYYMRRYLTFLTDLLGKLDNQPFELSVEVYRLLEQIKTCFTSHLDVLNKPISDETRKHILDQLGQAGSDYRTGLYNYGPSELTQAVNVGQIIEFLQLALKHVDHSIQANERADGLYHAYNLIKFTDQGITIRHMYEMLEGQVAVLSSGYLSLPQVIRLLRALRNSKLYRPDQNSYILYPYRELPRFLEKNQIPSELIDKSELLKTMLERGDRRIVYQDVNGAFHFNSNFANGRLLAEALNQLAAEYPQLVPVERQIILDIYEAVFDHQSFTGRSGTFYKYEGLGSIYWHMVSKLLLAVNESFYWAYESGADQKMLNELKTIYYDIREGIGVHKSPDVYGAFPTDAYSHTPLNSGAQQPGMTGQVKEDILSRFGELGVRVKEGQIHFEPVMLKKEEFLSAVQPFQYWSVKGDKRIFEVKAESLVFTVCQVPVIYHLANEYKVVVTLKDGQKREFGELKIDPSLSQVIFRRMHSVQEIAVFLQSVR